MKMSFFSKVILLGMFVISIISLSSFSSGSPGGRTASPGDVITCTQCHFGSSLNSGNAVVSITSGLDDKTRVIVFPNPCIDEIHISSDYTIDKVFLLNSSGELLMKYPQNTQSLNLTQFTSGVYFIKIFSNSKSIIQKIILD